MLSVRSVSKSYGSVRALSNVSLDFMPGEVHAVLGENGAGKSTLMGVIAGFVRPDGGEIVLGDDRLPADPVAVRRRGIEMVHQHFMLVPNFKVEENIALASLSPLARRLELGPLTKQAMDMASSLGWHIDPKAPTGTLPVGIQQRVEIVKALAGSATVLILDEPTAVLAPDEVADLMGVLRQLRDHGVTVILIAHKLSEVMGIADRASVLRDGRLVASTLMSETTGEQLAGWMVGGREPPSNLQLGEGGVVVLRAHQLEVTGDRGEVAVRGFELELKGGEIFGVGGVDGNGQVELAEALARVRPLRSGRLEWSGRKHPVVAYIPQDRQTDGLALKMSVEDNLKLAAIADASLRFGPFLRPKAVRDWSRSLVERFEIKATSTRQAVGGLSGGNQQKVVVARALARQPDLLVAVNPTRGLDLKATDYVHGRILEAAAKGAAVVLISTDQDEIEALSDRWTFLSRGRTVDRLVGADI